MKNKIAILSSLLCLCGINGATASDCIGLDCNIEPMQISEPTVLDSAIETTKTIQTIPTVAEYATPVEYVYGDQIPMRQVKLLSIKPVPTDTRPKVWDGTHGKYVRKTTDKTVDWRDGVPIWDDSISNYKQKDFSDWFLEPMDELYVRQADTPPAQMSDMELYTQTMEDAAATRARVEELLAPKKPSENLWIEKTDISQRFEIMPRPEYTAQDMTEIVNVAFECDDGCPFETETECAIWRRKPIVRETVSPRSKKIRMANLNEFLDAFSCNKNIEASDPAAAPLLERYKMLMKSAQACCTDGMAYSLKQAGASDGLVYKFLADDANFYGFGGRCLMMTDNELDAKYPNTATAAVAADVRNGCLCRGRQWFSAMLAPFQQAYQAAPEFKNSKFYYTYTDGLQRRVTVSINNDVQNVLNQLELCP